MSLCGYSHGINCGGIDIAFPVGNGGSSSGRYGSPDCSKLELQIEFPNHMIAMMQGVSPVMFSYKLCYSCNHLLT